MNSKSLIKSGLSLSILAMSLNAIASESFKYHYSPAGTLTGESTLTIEDRSGFFGSLTGSVANVQDAYDAGGNSATNFNVIGGVPGASPSNPLGVAGTFQQSVNQAVLTGGYVTHDKFLGGKLIGAITVPIMQSTRTVTEQLDGATEAKLKAQYGPIIGAGAIAKYNAQLAALGASKSGSAGGLGDIETTVAWSYLAKPNLKYLAGVTVTAPTGVYDANNGNNLGLNYWTIKPSVAALYDFGNFALGGRGTYGYNTTNNDTNYKSGNFVAFELTGGYRIPGVANIGLNLTQFNQIEDDSYSGAVQSIQTDRAPGGLAVQNGTSVPIDGGQRSRFTAMSPFIAFPIPAAGAVFTLQYTRMFTAADSLYVNNAITARWTQAF
jgi:hypothetical protein